MLGQPFLFLNHERWQLFWNNPNQAAAFLACLLPFFWGFNWLKLGLTIGFISRTMLFGLELFLWVALIFTYSRGGLIAIILAYGLYGFLQKTNFLSPISISRYGWIIAWLITSDFNQRLDPGFVSHDLSIAHRWKLWQGGLRMIDASPWTGWGIGQSGAMYMQWFQPLESTSRYHSMVNSYLTFAVERGLPWLVLVLVALITPFVLGLKALPYLTNEKQKVLTALLGSLLAWYIASLFSNLWTTPSLWIIPGLAIVAIWFVSLAIAKRPHILFSVLFSSCLALITSLLLLGGGRWEQQDFTAYPWPLQLVRFANASLNLAVLSDKSVLGEGDGKELRRLMVADPTIKTLKVLPNSTDTTQSNILIFFGEYPTNQSNLSAQKIILVHPKGFPSDYIPNVITLILPTVDETGHLPVWKEWASIHNVPVIISPDCGQDIRAAWPEVILPCLMKVK